MLAEETMSVITTARGKLDTVRTKGNAGVRTRLTFTGNKQIDGLQEIETADRRKASLRYSTSSL